MQVQVYITKRYRGQDLSGQSPSSYNFGSSGGSTIINNYGGGWPEDSIATFMNAQQPAINDWTIYAGMYGQYPKFMMIITDEQDGEVLEIPDGEEWGYEFTKPPKRIRTNGLLTSVIWDLPNIMTGYIIISK